MSYRFKVKLVDGQWYMWFEGPLDQRLVRAESVECVTVGDHKVWLGQVHAPNLKMALVRLQHLIPELQED